MRVVINKCWGGFHLSDKVLKEYNKRTRKDVENYNIDRADPILIEIIERIGLDKASGSSSSKLKIVEIPDGTPYTIFDYDGIETVVDKRFIWE